MQEVRPAGFVAETAPADVELPNSMEATVVEGDPIGVAERECPASDGTRVTSPTDAHHAMLTLLQGVVVEVARRRQDVLPGLTESLQDDVLLTTGGTTRSAYGWFAKDAWRHGDRHVHELFLNADHRNSRRSASVAEDVLTTLLHEACHVYTQMNGIRDTSRDGRYHNRRFGEIALAIGLAVERDAVVGHRTSGLLPEARVDYADLLGELERGLVLAREPRLAEAVSGGAEDPDDPAAPVTSVAGPPPRPAKYVFASCQCQDGRGRAVTIRVAVGSWRPDVICCSVCSSPFRGVSDSAPSSRDHGTAR